MAIDGKMKPDLIDPQMIFKRRREREYRMIAQRKKDGHLKDSNPNLKDGNVTDHEAELIDVQMIWERIREQGSRIIAQRKKDGYLNVPEPKLKKDRSTEYFGPGELANLRLKNEHKRFLLKEVPIPCDAGPVDGNMYHWKATLYGPPDGRCKEEKIVLNIELPHLYPFEPPKVTFLTKVYHPNINSNGNFDLFILKKENWSCRYRLSTILQQIYALLIEPPPHDARMLEIANMCLTNHSKYEASASS